MSPLDDVAPDNDAADGGKTGLVEKVAGRAVGDSGGKSELFDIPGLIEAATPQHLIEFELSQLFVIMLGSLHLV